MQRQILKSGHRTFGFVAGRCKAILATASLLLLAACGGGGETVLENNLAEPGRDGVAPVLTSVTIKMSRDANPSAGGQAQMGQDVRLDIVASEGLAVPRVTINGVVATVTGSVTNWSAVRTMDATDAEGPVTFSIVYQDISGELGQAVDTTTDGSAVEYCMLGCAAPGGGSLEGEWRLDGEGSAGVGPAAGDVSWWSLDAAGVTARACWLDDTYTFGSDGSFTQDVGADTWLEPFQGVAAEQCGAPVAPHDGSTAGTYDFDDAVGSLTINGTGLHLGLAKVVNGLELAAPGAAPASITYDVQILDATTLVVTIEANPGEWWTFRFAKAPVSPLVGKWKLDGEGSAGVGPTEGDISWWSVDAAAVTARACWFDDVVEFGADGSFRNTQGAETWLEPWQGVAAEECGAPVAPHDGSNGAIFEYDEAASTLKLTGTGAHLGLPKVTNGAEIASPASAPGSVTYNVAVLDGDTMTVTIDVGTGWWQFRYVRVSNSPLVGKWKLAGEGSAGVGPASGDISWWSLDAPGVIARACWLDDVYHFGDDGSFQNFQDGDTWLEPFQGVAAEQCGAPVAPHDGSSAGSFSYDDTAGTLTIDGRGSFLGLPKAVNGAELADPSAAPDFVTYDVLTIDNDNVTVTVETAAGTWWTFALQRVNDTAPLAGKWVLDGEGSAGVGPAEGDISWWSADAAAVTARSCWFNDTFEFGADGSFTNVQGSETWLEPWQGTAAEQCGAPVAPHDGSNGAIFEYDDAAGTLKLTGTGAHLGLPKTVNGAELASPASAPGSVTYNVAVLDGDTMTVTIDVGTGWWQYRLRRASSSPLVGNWKLDGEGAAGVGPTSGDVSWWSADAASLTARACWFDDVYHFGADGSFLNFQDGDTWLEPFQGVAAEQCGAPVAPHDGSSAGSFSYDDAAGSLTLNGRGSFIGLPKAVNGSELADPSAAPDFVTYDVLTQDGDTLTVTVETAAGTWWTFRIAKD